MADDNKQSTAILLALISAVAVIAAAYISHRSDKKEEPRHTVLDDRWTGSWSSGKPGKVRIFAERYDLKIEAPGQGGGIVVLGQSAGTLKKVFSDCWISYGLVLTPTGDSKVVKATAKFTGDDGFAKDSPNFLQCSGGPLTRNLTLTLASDDWVHAFLIEDSTNVNSDLTDDDVKIQMTKLP